MKDCVKYLKEGWYGNGDKFPDNHAYRKQPVNCQKLWDKCLHFAGTKYMDMCSGISGMMGQLEIDPNWQDESVSIPIDTLVVNLTEEEDVDGETYEGAEL